MLEPELALWLTVIGCGPSPGSTTNLVTYPAGGR